MRILYLSQYFPPEMGAPAARVHELSREWVRLGHRVTVLTGFPNHPKGVVPPEYLGRKFLRETVDGIAVVRLPIYVAANRGVARRSLSYLSYSLSASFLGPLVGGAPDVVIGTSPQFLTGLAGLWNGALRRVPFVFEVRDLWPRSIVEVGALKAGSIGIRLLEKLETFLYRTSDHIVVVSESFVDEIAAHGIDRKKLSVVTNGVDLDLFRPGDRDQARGRLGIPEGFLVTYVGTHGMAHGLATVLDAAKKLADSGVRFLLVGEGAEKQMLQARARAEHIENVSFWDQRPREEVASILAASDVCLMTLRDRPLFRTVIPSKMFEFMAAARPIVSTVDGESRRILDRASAGIFSPPEDADTLAKLLSKLADGGETLGEMGRRGRAYVEAHYSRPALARLYLEVLDRVIRETVRPSRSFPARA